MKELEGRKIATIQGFGWIDQLKAIKGAKLKLYDTSDAAIRDLLAGRIEALFADPPLIQFAIAKNPDVLLCDEPTGALDSKTGVVVLEALQRVNQELGTTTAVITHNAGIAQMADRVIKLADGRISQVSVNDKKLAPGELSW